MPRRYVIVAVCLALVLVCAGLLFPAVQKVREAAARMTCHSYFKGWAVHLHLYAEANPVSRGEKGGSAFPAGTVPHPALPPEQRWSWWSSVLPHSDIGMELKQLDLTRGPGDPQNQKAVNNRFRHLVCPSSGEYYDHNEGGRWKSPTPLTHYVGVAGVGADAAELPLKHPRAGIFGYDRRTAIADITDGMSNTLLLIETAHNPGHWAYGGTATVRAFELDAAPYLGDGRPFGGWHGFDLLGRKRSPICVVAMADGSVRSLNNSTAAHVLEALATVGGKEEVPKEW